MAVKSSPITPAVLEWGLDQDGRSPLEVASAAGIDPVDLDSWIGGTAQPSTGQVTALTKALHRPRAFFFLPAPPASGAIPDGFRHPPGGAEHSVTSDMLWQARRAKRIQLALAAAVEVGVDLPLGRVGQAPAEVARKVRDWLGLVERPDWATEYDALRGWRALLETAGVMVFNLQLGKGAVRGFASWDDRAPMIVLNSSGVAPQARIYTIGHELGHLALRQATACVEPAGDALAINTKTERWCERFSAAFLMPAEQVRSAMRRGGVAKGEADISAVKSLMGEFHVSARAAAARLVDLGYAADGLYPAVLRVFKMTERKADTTSPPRNPPRHKMRRRQYGDQAIGRVFSSLTPEDAMSVLRLSVDDVRELADEVPGVPAL